MRSESGQSTVELAGTIVWLLLSGLFAFQLAVAGWTVVSAGNAARTAARLVSRGDSQSDATNAGIKGLAARGLDTANIAYPTASDGGDKVLVTVRIPPVFPGISVLKLTISEGAEIPPTG